MSDTRTITITEETQLPEVKTKYSFLKLFSRKKTASGSPGPTPPSGSFTQYDDDKEKAGCFCFKRR